MPQWLREVWDSFWYFRRGKIKYYVNDLGDTFNAMATNGEVTVYNCYGSTPEQAKEMANYKLKQALERDEMLKKGELIEEIVFEENGVTIGRIKATNK